MLSTLIAIAWEPGIRGVVSVLAMVVVLIGGSYLVVGTNLGARLGFLIILSALFGWMTLMGAVWWTYGIGLKGPEPSWKPAEPTTIIRDAELLTSAGILDGPIADSSIPAEKAKAASAKLQEEGWRLLPDSDPQRGQAVASSDAILQIEAEEFAAGDYLSVAVFDRGGDRYPKINEALDFFAFFHEPRYALVQVVPVVPQRTEPGRAPARAVADETQEHRYVYLLRDLGAKRQPAIFITFGSGLIFAILCWLLHRRDLALRENLAKDNTLVKA